MFAVQRLSQSSWLRFQLGCLVTGWQSVISNLTISNKVHTNNTSGADEEQITSRTKRDNRIRFFVINNRPSDALELLERSLFRTPIQDQGKMKFLKLPPASVCNKVLDSAAVANDPDLVERAAELASALQLQGVPVETRTAQTLIHSLASGGMVDRGIQLVDGWLNANRDTLEDDAAAQDGPLRVLTSLLEAAARADDPDAIQQTLLRMARVGLNPLPHTMTSIIQCFSRLGHVNTAHSILLWMRRSGMEPTATTYAALMTLPSSYTPQFARTFLQKAKEAYDDMKSNDVEASPYFYASYINVCSRLRDLEAARDAWLDMEASPGIEPDLVCYNTMIDACAKGGDVDGALHLYEEMRAEKGIKPDAVAYATLLTAVRGSIDQARQLWRDMMQSGISTPDYRTTTVYIDALLRAGDGAGVCDVLLSVGGLDGDDDLSGLYEHAVSATSSRLQTKFLTLLIDQMEKEGVTPTLGQFNAVLSARSRKLRSKWKRELSHSQDELKERYRFLDTSNAISMLKSMVEEGSASSHEDQTRRDPEEVSSPSVPSPAAETRALLSAWYAAEGDMDKAIDMYIQTDFPNADSIPTAHGDDNNNVAILHGWVLNALITGALAESNAEKQAALLIKILGFARKFSNSTPSRSWWWDNDTQKKIIRTLKKSPAAAALLGSDGDENNDAMRHGIDVVEMNQKVWRMVKK